MTFRSIFATMATAAAVVALGSPSPAATEPSPTCSQPYLPWYQSTSNLPAPPPDPDTGRPIDLRSTAQPPDTNGDGQADVITLRGEETIVISRADGDVVLTLPGGSLFPVRTVSEQPGDLDGDGKDEFFVDFNGRNQRYLVPGGLAPGHYNLPDTAIDLGPLPVLSFPVGDQNGDGGADVVFPVPIDPPYGDFASIDVYSGLDLLAPGPGGRLDGAPASIASYDGNLIAAAPLEPGTVLTIISGRLTRGGMVDITVHTSPEITLQAADVAVDSPESSGNISVSQQGSTRFVKLNTGIRGSATTAIWNLDDPCSRYAGPSPSETTTTTVPTGPPDTTTPGEPPSSTAPVEPTTTVTPGSPTSTAPGEPTTTVTPGSPTSIAPGEPQSEGVAPATPASSTVAQPDFTG